jgi:MFS family permease
LVAWSPYLVAAALFVASIGNSVYAVANQTALLETADEGNRASMMASRFTLATAASIVGFAAGGLISQSSGGPLAAYGVLAVGLILLGLFALAAGRVISSPLLGREYEEATQLEGSGHEATDGHVNGEAGHTHDQTALVTPGKPPSGGVVSARR